MQNEKIDNKIDTAYEIAKSQGYEDKTKSSTITKESNSAFKARSMPSFKPIHDKLKTPKTILSAKPTPKSNLIDKENIKSTASNTKAKVKIPLKGIMSAILLFSIENVIHFNCPYRECSN